MDRLYLQNKHGYWEDKTATVANIGANPYGEYLIRFNSSKTQYSYSPPRVAFVRAEDVPVNKDCAYRIGEKVIYNPSRITTLESDNSAFPNKVEVQFGTDKPYSYPASRITALPLSRTSSLFQALSRIAEATRPSNSPQEIRDYLPNQYKRLGDQPLTGCAAEFLTSPETPCSTTPASAATIYPFGSNLSQMDAVDAALSNRLSLIEGPPGTGKTQTILNIIANLLLRNQTILVASPNNEATKNVSDKLTKEGLGFLVAALGNSDNSKIFVTTQDAQKEYPPSTKEWALTQEERSSLAAAIADSKETLRDFYANKQQIAKAQEELRALELEFSYFSERNQAAPIHHRASTSLENLRTLRDTINRLTNSGKPMPLFPRLKAVLFWGIGHWRDYSTLTVNTELSIDRAIYDLSISDAKARIHASEQFLQSHNSNGLIATVTTNSRKLLQDALYQHYAAKLNSPRLHFENPWESPEAFRSEYPIITSTTNAARNQMGKGGSLFDYIIIDESSQADLVTGFLALASAKNAVVVGDTKQLPCVITEQDKEKAAPILEKAALPDSFNYTKSSLLACLIECVQHHGLRAPRALLKEHYRCHPDIIGFCNQQFYNGELIIMTEPKNPADNNALFYSLSNPGNFDRSSDFNRIQAKMFAEEALPLLRETYSPSEIGAATPYRAQANGMKQLDEIPETVQIDTIHKYQGREKDAIAFITRANTINDFVDNPNLVNVAVSRAKSAFYLIAAPQVVEGTSNIADLKRWIDYRSGKRVETKVSPAFPFLYSNMLDKRAAYISSHGAAANDEYSEVQMREYALEVLRNLGAESQIGICRNYPFKLLFSHKSNLFDAEETRFIHTSAHADFIFFRRIDKSVILELEVNGSQHETNPTQAHRDKTKQQILKNAGIPQCVIRTNEEKEAALALLRNALMAALESSESLSAHLQATSVAVSTDETPWETSADTGF